MDDELLRIGELSRRAGVSPELLRAWERRYGLLDPRRSAGGLRLYSAADLERVRRMRRHLDDGVAAAEAAALALSDGASEPRAGRSAGAELTAALLAFDEARAQAALDRLLADVTIDTVVTEVLSSLRELGDGWARGSVSIAQEHFASGVIRGRLLGLARGWGRGAGPAAVLACLAGERHDLGLIGFGLALRARGWRVTCLGGDTPMDTVEEAAAGLEPELTVLSAVTAERVRPVSTRLRALAERRRVALGGQAAREVDAEETGAILLSGTVVEAADACTP
jgi:MerR family transcriptional regulator, light-induced transcriptional regulator